MMSDEGTLVVFAKCPMPGKSKTRLSGLLGLDGSAFLAKAMLSDVLKSISEDVSISQIECEYFDFPLPSPDFQWS